MAYDIEQVTNMFDTLSNKIIESLDIQYNKGRLKGTDYANAYSTLLNTVIQLCIDIPLKDKQIDKINKDIEVENKTIEKIDKEIDNLDANINLANANTALVDRQREGFEDNFILKEFSTQFSGWSSMFSTGLLEEAPTIVSSDALTQAYNKILEKTGDLPMPILDIDKEVLSDGGTYTGKILNYNSDYTYEVGSDIGDLDSVDLDDDTITYTTKDEDSDDDSIGKITIITKYDNKVNKATKIITIKDE